MKFKRLYTVYPAHTSRSHFDISVENMSWKFVAMESSYSFLILRVKNVFTTREQRAVSAYVFRHRRLIYAASRRNERTRNLTEKRLLRRETDGQTVEDMSRFYFYFSAVYGTTFVIFQPLFLVDVRSVSNTVASATALTTTNGDENCRTIHGISRGVRHEIQLFPRKNPCKSFPSETKTGETRPKIGSDAVKNRYFPRGGGFILSPYFRDYSHGPRVDNAAIVRLNYI